MPSRLGGDEADHKGVTPRTRADGFRVNLL